MGSNNLKISILINKVPWFGKYSGYESLPQYLPNSVRQTIFLTKNNLKYKILGKWLKLLNKIEGRSEDIYNQEMFVSKFDKTTASHILYLENNFSILVHLNKYQKGLIGTIHIPISLWRKTYLEKLSKLEYIILLYKEDIELFGQYIPKERIHLILHGVDVQFFKPSSNFDVKMDKVLFVGHFLRNFEMFFKVFETIINNYDNKFEFHFIIPSEHRHPPVLQKLLQYSNVYFHENLTDEEMLKHYQNSYVMLMPLEESGANTAIVQALSTGLPIITTDVGGIRSYGAETIFPVVKNGDVDAMVKLFDKYHTDVDFRNTISNSQRNFAIQYLDWNKIASQHLELYHKIINN